MQIKSLLPDRTHVNLGRAMLQVQTARDKLQGRHPSDVLLAELAPKYSSTAHWAALQVRSPMLPCCTSSLPYSSHATAAAHMNVYL